MRFTPLRTVAREVRTGHIIRTPYTPHLYTLEVETVSHQRHVSTEGDVTHAIRFTGWLLFNGQIITRPDGTRDGRVVDGWSQLADGRVHVVDDMRRDWSSAQLTYGWLTGRTDVAQLRAELTGVLAAASCTIPSHRSEKGTPA